MQMPKITQIPEEAHNISINTLMATRQELLFSRQHIQNLEKALEEGRTLNDELCKRIEVAIKQREDILEGRNEISFQLAEAQKRIAEFDLAQLPDNETGQ